MKAIAVLPADFDRSPLGTRSRLDEPLADGETILRRTIERLRRAKRIASIHVAVHVSQKERADAAAAGLDVTIETHTGAPPAWQPLLTAARKWALDGWRGGLGDAAAMDEDANVWLFEALARRDGADVVVPVPAAAAFVDPELVDAMIEHMKRVREELRMVFAPAPPGLAPPILTATLLEDLCKAGWPPGRLLAYRPERPQHDLLFHDCCYRPAAVVEHAWGRLFADTDSAVDRLAALCAQIDNAATAPAATIAQWLHDRDRYAVGPLPREVEIELTTDDPLAETTLRPRGDRVGRRGPTGAAMLDALFAELATRDDSLIVFGGFGEPLLHPDFAGIVRRARAAGVFGIAVRTNALALDPAAIDALLAAKVDVVNVLLDAHSAETYREVHRHDGYDAAVANVNALLDARANRQSPLPIVVPEMTKTRRTLREMEAFYDEWTRKTSAAVVRGPAAYGGAYASLELMNMAPPNRFACLRLWSRTIVLADGRVTACDQDATGAHAIGTLRDATLHSLWTGPRMESLRAAHRNARYEEMPLCPACREWHRP